MSWKDLAQHLTACVCHVDAGQAASTSLSVASINTCGRKAGREKGRREELHALPQFPQSPTLPATRTLISLLQDSGLHSSSRESLVPGRADVSFLLSGVSTRSGGTPSGPEPALDKILVE